MIDHRARWLLHTSLCPPRPPGYLFCRPRYLPLPPSWPSSRLNVCRSRAQPKDSVTDDNNVEWTTIPEDAYASLEFAHGGKNGMRDQPMREYLVEIK